MAFDPQNVGKSLTTAGDATASTGEKLITASKFTKRVARALSADGDVVPSLQSVETGTRSTRNLLGLTVPPLRAGHSPARDQDSDDHRADRRRVGRLRFVTGVTIGTARPFLAAAASVRAVANNLNNVRAALLTVANAMRNLRRAMPDIRDSLRANADDIATAGKSLQDSVKALQDAGAALGG
jgi:hypothetical protein